MQQVPERLAVALEGRYEVRSEIGRGGMAGVYLAEDLRHHRRVAIKVLRPELSEALGAERFLREIEVAAGLVHPHIVPLHDSGEAAGLFFYVMPYLEGETLRGRLDREGVLPVPDAVAVLRDVASALDYAHGQGVVHRDVKPSNVMLSDGGALLADFGVALALQEAGRSRLTGSGTSLGTPDYMSPEQAMGAGNVDGRSDIYALGCLAYEMLGGEAPFTGRSAQVVVARHIGAPPPDVRLLRPSVPAEAEAAIRRALSKEPVDRFDTAGELADAVATAVARGATVAPTGAGPTRPSARHRALLLPAGAVAALLAAAGVAYLVLADAAPPSRAGAPVPRQITFQGDVRMAYGSPDGEFLAYETVEDGVVRLFVAEGDAGSPVEIYRSEGFACCPAWSPDGSRILMRDGPRTTGRGLLIPRLGGDARPLPTDVVTAWSPDGGQVVGWWPAADTLRIVDVTTGEPSGFIPLGLGHEWIAGVDWSPDGRRLAVATTEGERADGAALWMVPLDGGQIREVLRDSVAIASPHWTATGDAVYVLRGGQDVWKVPVDPGGAAAAASVRLAAGLSPNIWNSTIPVFSVSADGSRLHYARWDGRANLVEVTLSGAVGAAESTRWLTSGTARRTDPRFSPDGRSVAFLQEGPGGWDVWIRDADGESRRVTFSDGSVASPAWSPDGRRLAFGGSLGSEPSVWVVDLDGGTTRRVGGDRYGGHEVVWLATGEILYQEASDQAYRLVDPVTGSERSLEAPEGSWLYGPRGSPDGRRVAFRVTGDQGGLWIVEPASDTWSRISERGLGPVGWSADGDTLYALPAQARSDASRELVALPARGGEPRLAAMLPEGMPMSPSNATLRPTDGVLVGAVFTSSVDVWVLDDFDPSR